MPESKVDAWLVIVLVAQGKLTALDCQILDALANGHSIARIARDTSLWRTAIVRHINRMKVQGVFVSAN